MEDAKTKVVPVEPTDEMLEAGEECIADRYLRGAGVYASDVYDAMLSAAPQPAASDVPHDVVRAAKKHAVELEQCSIFAADVGPFIAKSMTDAAVFLRALATPAPSKGMDALWSRDMRRAHSVLGDRDLAARTSAPSASTAGFLATLTEEQRAQALSGDLDDSGVICAPSTSTENWRDDPSTDDRWNAGVDFAQTQLCAVLKIDPKSITWDGGTETLDGDVQSAICKVLTAWAGDNWMDRPSSTEEALRAARRRELEMAREKDQAMAEVEAAREFVLRHPRLTETDHAEFEAFLKVPAAFAALSR